MFYDSKHVHIVFPVVGPARLSLIMDVDRAPPACPRRRQCARTLAGVVLLLAGARLAAQTAPPDAAPERRIKAAFLYKFLGYTEFPASAFGEAAAPLVIGVIGADELGAELGRIVAGRTALSRAITVKLLHESDSAAGVHLLFVGGSDSARVRSVLAQLKASQAAPMLVVSEADDGLQQGSVINFRVIDERVRFDVSLDAAEKNNIKLSSRLLTVANHVQKGAL
ncbi:MAG: YfiR family protein [Pseudomonadota bacterium]